VGHVPCARARHFRKGKERPPSALRPHPQEPQLFLIHSLSDLQFFDNHKCIRRATLLHQVSTRIWTSKHRTKTLPRAAP